MEPRPQDLGAAALLPVRVRRLSVLRARHPDPALQAGPGRCRRPGRAAQQPPARPADGRSRSRAPGPAHQAAGVARRPAATLRRRAQVRGHLERVRAQRDQGADRPGRLAAARCAARVAALRGQSRGPRSQRRLARVPDDPARSPAPDRRERHPERHLPGRRHPLLERRRDALRGQPRGRRAEGVLGHLLRLLLAVPVRGRRPQRLCPRLQGARSGGSVPDRGHRCGLHYRAFAFTQKDNFCRLELDRAKATLRVRVYDRDGRPVAVATTTGAKVEASVLQLAPW